ncbi:MAG: hypothetical protein IJX09_05050 [Clostridia bacterium]|nr:hypothetical protein [Clostridia bacterium]
MNLERVVKKPIAIVQASFDERYLICTHNRAKFSILDTQTDTFIFEKKIRPGTSMCFSADDSELYVYDSGKKTVEFIAVGTWKSLDLVEIPEFRKADKDNWGDIFPTKNGFCINFCWKHVRDGEYLRWNMLFYNRKTGEKRIFENCAYLNYDAMTGDTIAVWQKSAYAVLSQDKGVEKEFYRDEEVDCDSIVFSTAKYTLKSRKYREKYTVRLMKTALEKENWREVCKVVLDFFAYTSDNFMQKDKLVLDGLDAEKDKHCFAVVDLQGNILAQTRGEYAFSGVVANGKLYVADWEKLIIVPLKQ